MSALNDEEILITIEELQLLKNEDISTCVDIYSVIKICSKSSTAPCKIYNLWAQKLFKAYDLKTWKSRDWQTIIEHLDNVSIAFVKHVSSSTITPCNDLEQFLLDSHELLKLVNNIINTLDFFTLSSIINSTLKILVGIYKFTNHRSVKLLCALLQLIINLNNNFLYKMDVGNCNELEMLDKIISSLCDVGDLIMSPDVKLYIEIWRSVAKLGAKLYNINKIMILNQSASSLNHHRLWHTKAILGIFKELSKIIRFYNESPGTSNDNLLQVMEFYLKLVAVVTNYSKDTMEAFPAIKEFMEVHAFCLHEMAKNESSKAELLVYKPLLDIFLLIHRDKFMVETLLHRLKNEAENFEANNFLFDYIKVNIKSCSANHLITPDVELLLRVYNSLVKGPLIFIDEVKYKQTLEYFAVITILDTMKQMHKKLCEYVLDSSWIRAYTSMEVLTHCYSYVFNQQKWNMYQKCLDFWMVVWNRLNKCNQTYRKNKKLVEILLKNILSRISNEQLQECSLNKYENFEIILFMSGKQNDQSLEYFYMNLGKNLKKMQERCINGEPYRELLNLLEICFLNPYCVNDFLKEDLLTTFTGLLTLSASELQRFQQFVNQSLRFFCLQQNEEQSEKLFKYLEDHQQQCFSIVQGAFLVEFLLKHRPRSNKLLKELETNTKSISITINLIDGKSLNKSPINSKVLNNLPQILLQSSNHNYDLEQIKKKPRVDKCNFSSIKFILNEINLSTHKLLHFPHSSFDAEDLELMRTIKSSIDKCLID